MNGSIGIVYDHGQRTGIGLVLCRDYPWTLSVPSLSDVLLKSDLFMFHSRRATSTHT